MWDAGRDVIGETRESAQPSRSGRQSSIRSPGCPHGREGYPVTFL